MASPPKVLVVDDDTDVLEMIEAAFEDEGFEVITSSTPLGVAAMVRRELPAAVVLDLEMPALDGRRVASFLGGIRPKPRLFFFSGKPEAEVVAAAAAFRNAIALHKSHGPQALATLVRQALEEE